MTPEQQATLINRSVQRVPIRTIGEELGVSHVTVLRHQQQPDTRARIQAEAEAIINGGLRVSRQATLRAAAETLRQYKAVSRQQPYDRDLIKLGLDASKTILQVAGLTGQPSTVINAMIQVNQAPGQAESNNLMREFLQSKLAASIQAVNQVDTKYPGNCANSSQSGESMTGIPQPHTPPMSDNVIEVTP